MAEPTPAESMSSKGGKAAAAKMTAAERKDRARKAAAARWAAGKSARPPLAESIPTPDEIRQRLSEVVREARLLRRLLRLSCDVARELPARPEATP